MRRRMRVAFWVLSGVVYATLLTLYVVNTMWFNAAQGSSTASTGSIVVNATVAALITTLSLVATAGFLFFYLKLRRILMTMAATAKGQASSHRLILSKIGKISLATSACFVLRIGAVIVVYLVPRLDKMALITLLFYGVFDVVPILLMLYILHAPPARQQKKRSRFAFLRRRRNTAANKAAQVCKAEGPGRRGTGGASKRISGAGGKAKGLSRESRPNDRSALLIT